MNVIEAMEQGATLAEIQGIPQEIGDAIACLAEAELEAGRVETARAILEGLVVTNHEDAGAWALLSQAHRRLGQPLAARFCAEVAADARPGGSASRDSRARRACSRCREPSGRRRARSCGRSRRTRGWGPRPGAARRALSVNGKGSERLRKSTFLRLFLRRLA